MSYTIQYNATTFAPTGIASDTGAVIPISTGNADFRAFLDWNAVQDPPLDYVSARDQSLTEVKIAQSSLVTAAYALAIATGFTDPVTSNVMSLTDQGRADLLANALGAVVSGAADVATITFSAVSGSSTLPFGSTGAGIATDATFRGLVVRTLSSYLGLRTKLATLLGQIAAATDVVGVQAVTW